MEPIDLSNVRHGLIIGKFYPFHKGHEYLIRYSMSVVSQVEGDCLDIIVCDNPIKENKISGICRFEAVKAFMHANFSPHSFRVFYRSNPIDPQDPSEHPDFWQIWKNIIHTFSNPTHIFSSEEYGYKLAEVLGCKHIIVNPARSIVPISGTEIRNNLLSKWSFISDYLKPKMQKKVFICGPESTGKTTLAKNLVQHFYGSRYIPEYGRDYFEMRDSDLICTQEDLRNILIGHEASICAAEKLLDPLLVIDTDAIATKIFSQMWYGDDDKLDFSEYGERYGRNNHYILLAPTVPWVKERLRNLEDEREEFFKKNINMIQRGFHTVISSSDFTERYNQAVCAVLRLLDQTIIW
jgi:HTH-type transcriptional repressor of NAD biosynthesis genes